MCSHKHTIQNFVVIHNTTSKNNRYIVNILKIKIPPRIARINSQSLYIKYTFLHSHPVHLSLQDVLPRVPFNETLRLACCLPSGLTFGLILMNCLRPIEYLTMHKPQVKMVNAFVFFVSFRSAETKTIQLRNRGVVITLTLILLSLISLNHTPTTISSDALV